MVSIRRLLLSFGPPLLGFALILVLWRLVAETAWGSRTPQTLWLAHPYDVLSQLFALSEEGWQSIWGSFLRVVVGFSLVAVAGILLGLLLGFAARLFRILEGPIDFWRSIPPVAVLPICFFLFRDTGETWIFGMLKTGDQARVACVVFGCLPIMVFQIADSVRGIPIARREFVEQIRASWWFRMRWLIAYELMPTVFRSLRTVWSFSVVIIVACEMAWGSGLGLGDRINATRFTENGLSGSYLYALAAGILGYLGNLLLRFLERRIVYWQ